MRAWKSYDATCTSVGAELTYSSAGNLNVDPRIPETPPLTSVQRAIPPAQRTIPPDRAAARWADAGTWEGLPV